MSEEELLTLDSYRYQCVLPYVAMITPLPSPPLLRWTSYYSTLHRPQRRP
jgi:hypothetical protein